MDEPIEETYFNWLYTQVASVQVPTPSLTFWTLFRDLHATEFVWLVSGDDNRAEDGRDLRKEFLRESFIPNENPAWMHFECSVLEMLIAFSRRAAFETDLSPREWFWIFMENLHLDGFNDAMPRVSEKVSEVMDRLVWRTYHPSGSGGMFPLRETSNDQTKVEIWYQFCEYLIDQERV